MACAGVCLGFRHYYEDVEHLSGRIWVNQGSCGVLSHYQDDPKSQSFVVLEMGWHWTSGQCPFRRAFSLFSLTKL